MSLFAESIFGGEELAPKLIETTEGSETKIDFEPLAVRAAKALKDVKSYHDMIEVLEMDQQLGNINVRYVPDQQPKLSITEYLKKVTQEKSEIQCDNKDYIVPIVKHSEVKVFKQVIEQRSAKILGEIQQIGELINVPSPTDVVNQMEKRIDNISKVTNLKLDKVQRGFLALQELDYFKHELTDSVMEKFTTDNRYFDALTAGLAIIEIIIAQ